MIAAMTAILYPVATNPEQALSRPLGRAAREREARRLAKEDVAFTTEPVGPVFATREAAIDAYKRHLEDERTGFQPAVEDRYCRLSAQMLSASGRTARLAPVEPTFQDGRRWPAPTTAQPTTVWRLMVSYWRLATAERPLEAPQARHARKSKQPLDPEALRAIARQPMRAVKPQQPLDIGLFETRLPEAPHIIVPDE